jgi:molybdopterin converting factor small subunit
MARVHFSDQLQQYTNGIAELQVEAKNYRELVHTLERQFPGIGTVLNNRVAVSIDGDLVHDPLLELISPDSEVHFLPKIAAG